MKAHCDQCEAIIEQVGIALEEIRSDDDTTQCAGLLRLASIISERCEPIGDGRWHIEPEESEV